MSLLRDPDWGFGLESYLSRPIPPTLAREIENAVREDDRVADARCTITKVADEEDAYRMDLTVACEDGFLELALSMSPTGGIVRVA